jgi:hypothetical protein
MAKLETSKPDSVTGNVTPQGLTKSQLKKIKKKEFWEEKKKLMRYYFLVFAATY